MFIAWKKFSSLEILVGSDPADFPYLTTTWSAHKLP